MSENVSFIQGSKENYNPSEVAGGIFFSKDTKEILLNGESYGNSVKADEEDITLEEGSLKLKDRSYNADNFSGKGYIILRKNIKEVTVSKYDLTITSGCTANGDITITVNSVENNISVTTDYSTPEQVAALIASSINGSSLDGAVVSFSTQPTYNFNSTGVQGSVSDTSYSENRNVLTQSMINEPNTIYEIRYDYNFDESLTIPNECELKFNGGSISSLKEINLNNCYISGYPKLFVKCKGKAKNEVVDIRWFGAKIYQTFQKSPKEFSDDAFSRCKDLVANTIYIPSGSIYVSKPISLTGKYVGSSNANQGANYLAYPTEVKKATILCIYGEDDATLLRVYGNNVLLKNIIIRNGDLTKKVDVLNIACNRSIIENVFVSESTKRGIVVNDGIYNNILKNITVANKYATGTVGMEFIYSKYWCQTMNIDMLFIGESFDTSIIINGNGIIFNNIFVQSQKKSIIEFQNANSCYINNIYSERTPDYANAETSILFSDKAHNCVIRNWYGIGIDLDKIVNLGVSCKIINKAEINVDHAGAKILCSGENLFDGSSYYNSKGKLVYGSDMFSFSSWNMDIPTYFNGSGKIVKHSDNTDPSFAYLNFTDNAINNSWTGKRIWVTFKMKININDGTLDLSRMDGSCAFSGALKIGTDSEGYDIWIRHNYWKKGTRLITWRLVNCANFDADIKDICILQDDDSFYPIVKPKLTELKSTSDNRPSSPELWQPYFDTTIGKPIWWSGDCWVTSEGNNPDILNKGNSDRRPSLKSTDEGFEYYDTTLNKKILWNGSEWVNMDGLSLDIPTNEWTTIE